MKISANHEKRRNMAANQSSIRTICMNSYQPTHNLYLTVHTQRINASTHEYDEQHAHTHSLTPNVMGNRQQKPFAKFYDEPIEMNGVRVECSNAGSFACSRPYSIKGCCSHCRTISWLTTLLHSTCCLQKFQRSVSFLSHTFSNLIWIK